MENRIPFFNWSVKRVLATEPDSFARARINILYTILLFSLLKIFIVIGVAVAHDQWLQVNRAVIALVLYLVLTKLLLYKPSFVPLITHTLLLFGLIVIWTNVFVFSHGVNLTTAQFMVMVVLCSFYTLGSRLGTIYSGIAMMPALLFFIFRNTGSIYLTRSPQELASPGFECIVMLNFLTVAVCHYLFYHAFNTNLKEKEALNDELQRSVAEANRLAQSKSDFLSTISHELRTPLNAVIGSAELLLDDKPAERQRDNLKILHGSAIDLLALINNVLDYNKMDAHKLSLEAIPLHLADFMQKICSAMRIKALDKNLDLVLHIDERLKNIWVVSDPTRLSQVMYNLIGNAIKFTDKGKVTIEARCVTVTGDKAEVYFSVSDTGYGIPADKHESIFNLFTQAGIDTTRRYGGTGLGLPIVRQVLSLFNSTIQVESTPGAGSKFFFSVSFTTTARPKGKETDLAPEDVIDLSDLKILIAEDVEINRVIIERQLEKLGVKAEIVTNGKLAYDAHVTGHYDAIFVDLHMPVWDGYETIKEIRALPGSAASVYVIALTAAVTEEEKIMAAGFNSILYKPVQISELRTKLEEILSLRVATV